MKGAPSSRALRRARQVLISTWVFTLSLPFVLWAMYGTLPPQASRLDGGGNGDYRGTAEGGWQVDAASRQALRTFVEFKVVGERREGIVLRETVEVHRAGSSHGKFAGQTVASNAEVTAAGRAGFVQLCKTNACEELLPLYDAAAAGMPASNLFARGAASVDYPWRRVVAWFRASFLWMIFGGAWGIVIAWNWFRWLEDRRALFRRRGLCVECGYDVGRAGGMNVCPECGSRVLAVS